MLWEGGLVLQSRGNVISKPVWGESWVLMGKGISEGKMRDAGDVKDLICHQLEGEAEPLRSGPRSWGERQVADDQVGT